MLRCIYFKNNELRITRDAENIFSQKVEDVLWVDLISPTDEEKLEVENFFKMELTTMEEAREIEISSKFYEDHQELSINSNFVVPVDSTTMRRESVSFILRHGILITLHETELHSFREVMRKLNSEERVLESELILMIMESRLDLEADLIELVTNEISHINTTNQDQSEDLQHKLIRINELLDKTMLLRESVTEKQRIFSSMLKSHRFRHSFDNELRIMLKDTSSLLEHTDFNFRRLEFYQSTIMGLINIDQNRIIKIFTVASLIFMPPTLIASLYGMNFKFMPELNEVWGYPFSLGLMLMSSVVTLIFFKKKGWL